jgi:hypothetical protein
METKNWSLPKLPAQTGGLPNALLVSGEVDSETKILSITACNYNQTQSAFVNVALYDADRDFAGYILSSGEIEPNTSLFIDTKVFLNDYQYVSASGSIPGVSLIACGAIN